jgi:hypothetical protein
MGVHVVVVVRVSGLRFLTPAKRHAAHFDFFIVS